MGCTVAANRPLANSGHRDLAAQVAGRLRAELDPVGDQLEGQDHLVGGVDEAGDVDGTDVVVAGQHGGRHRRDRASGVTVTVPAKVSVRVVSLTVSSPVMAIS